MIGARLAGLLGGAKVNRDCGAMVKLKLMLVGALLMGCGPVLAEENDGPPLPRPRPNSAAFSPDVTPRSALAREETEAPQPVYQVACPAVLDGRVLAKILPSVRAGQCGLQSPYEVRGVMVGDRQVGFSNPVTTNCEMATALLGWMTQVDGHVRRVLETQISEVQTGTSYICRSRNGVAGAKLSEHGFGNALDVTGFVFADGQKARLPEDWAQETLEAETMRFAHEAACGIFTTVLGPNANAQHADHLHLDLGCHGQSCTWRVCE